MPFNKAERAPSIRIGAAFLAGDALFLTAKVSETALN